jgi:hypothetical protein
MEHNSNNMTKREFTDRVNAIETVADLMDYLGEGHSLEGADLTGIAYILTEQVAALRCLLEYGAELTEGEVADSS